jgi:GNAT superfamily N-acetyltransferase
MPATAVTTRVLDLADEPGIRAWHAAGLAVHRHDRPDAPFWTEDEVVHLLRPDDPEEKFLPLVAEQADGAVVGTAIVFVPLEDNLDKVYVQLSVLPAHRGQGVGDALMEQVVAAARSEGRELVLVQAYLPADADDTHPVRRFAARHGFALANTEVRRVLELPVAEETIAGWVAAAAPHHVGYEIATYVDVVPDDLVPSLVELLNQLAVDAPTGDIEFEAGAMTPEVYREQSRRRLASGRRIYETVAVKDGRVVAQSTMSVPPHGEELPHLNQWGTYVHREHRGHRLGLAVKAANLRVVQRAHPERTLVSTTNSPANAPMVAINELMGFRPADVMHEFLRRL